MINILKNWQIILIGVFFIAFVISVLSGCGNYKRIAQLKIQNEELTIRLNNANTLLESALQNLSALPQIEVKTDTIFVNSEKIIKISTSNNEMLNKINIDIEQLKKEISEIKGLLNKT